jgi:hypothetical protein
MISAYILKGFFGGKNGPNLPDFQLNVFQIAGILQ